MACHICAAEVKSLVGRHAGSLQVTGATYGPRGLGAPLEGELLGVKLDFEGGLDGAVFDPGDAGLAD